MNDEDRELLIGIYIQLSRVLDALYVIAGPVEGKKLNDTHTAGNLLSSEPFLRIEDDEAVNDE